MRADIVLEAGLPAGANVGVGRARLAAQGQQQGFAQPGMVVEVDGLVHAGVDEAMVGGDDDEAVVAAGNVHQLGEGRVERGEGLRHGATVDAVFVGQAVELGPVGMDVAARRCNAQQPCKNGEHLLQGFIAVPFRPAAEGDVEVGMDDVARADHVAGQGQAVEQRGEAEQRRRRDACLAQGVTAGADAEGQRRGNGADLAEIHVPAGEAVLLRGEAGEEGGDGAGRGGGEDRGHLSAQVLTQGAVAAEQEIVAQAIHHQQHQMARPGQDCGRQRRQWRIGAAPAQGAGDGAHEVDDAAAAVVGQGDGEAVLPGFNAGFRRHGCSVGEKVLCCGGVCRTTLPLAYSEYR